jgi:hypothetical protein
MVGNCGTSKLKSRDVESYPAYTQAQAQASPSCHGIFGQPWCTPWPRRREVDGGAVRGAGWGLVRRTHAGEGEPEKTIELEKARDGWGGGRMRAVVVKGKCRCLFFQETMKHLRWSRAGLLGRMTAQAREQESPNGYP